MPAQCDIVYGRFPYPPNLSSPGREPHYCLVLDVFLDPETQEPWVIVAMGTSKNVTSLYTGELLINTVDRPDTKSGLSKPTKFSLARSKVAKLPYNDVYFEIAPERRSNPNATPKIGTFDAQKHEAALSAAGKAADTAKTIADLESLDVGLLAL